ncbi:MAG: hypothetical protein RI947_445 [Candidatus Parcubacteria bacterium]|jgi:zinc transport system substrate-binding protein
MHILRNKLGVSLLITLLVLSGFVLLSTRSNKQKSDRLHITASFYPLGEFARQIAGPNVTIDIITPAGIEPHDYEPTAKDIAAIRSSSLFIYNGNGVDGWADKIANDLTSAVRVVNIKESLHVTSSDPHYWLDPVLVQAMVKNIKTALINQDPAHTALYEKNAAAYIQELSKLHEDIRKGLKTCAKRQIVVSHAAFGYFAKRYGLTEMYIAGISPEEEPSPKRLAEIADYAKIHQAKYIFFESLVSPKLSETIATEIGAKTMVLNPVEGLSEEEIKEGYTYISVMRKNLNNLREALSCQ